jgi:hypothetical protein
MRLVMTARARLVGDGVGAVLARGHAAADAVAALRALAGARDFAFERSARGFAFGADALALGLFGFAVSLALGVLGLLFFVLDALGFIASRVALGDLLQAFVLFFTTNALTFGFFGLLRGKLRGFLLRLFASAFGFFGLLLARFGFLALFFLALGLFGFLRFEAFGFFALLFAFALFFLALFFFLLSELETRRVLLTRFPRGLGRRPLGRRPSRLLLRRPSRLRGRLHLCRLASLLTAAGDGLRQGAAFLRGSFLASDGHRGDQRENVAGPNPRPS